MTFEDYIDIIRASVANTGYNQFFPSLCVSKETADEFAVLETELSEGGEEELAMNWVENVVGEHHTTFLAFRAGGGIVNVRKIVGFDAILQTNIRVEPVAKT
jgi:hypothetical protein